jgi:hypothetical protein
MPVLKGAFLNFGAGLLGALPNVVVFQFNPETISRTPSLAQQPTTPTDAAQQPAQPSESMSFSLRLDATDQLASGNPIAAASGILPALSALELLMVPKSSLTIDLSALAGTSPSSKQQPARLPVVLLVWGPWRIVPVQITSMSINETEYDQLLNPIRAEVSVSLQILTPNQLPADATLALGAYKYSEGVKEVQAALNLANTAALGISASLSVSF